MDQIPQFSTQSQGLLLFLFGLILFLHVTNILVFGTNTVLLLAALALMAYGFGKMNGYNKLKRLLKK